VKTLGALEARFDDDHVPLGLVLGALSAFSAVRRLLPEEAIDRASRSSTVAVAQSEGQRSSPEPFLALLLGAIAIHDRLLAMLGTMPARDSGVGQTVIGGGAPRPEGLLR
jgi:hypothetical protein